LQDDNEEVAAVARAEKERLKQHMEKKRELIERMKAEERAKDAMGEVTL